MKHAALTGLPLVMLCLSTTLLGMMTLRRTWRWAPLFFLFVAVSAIRCAAYPFHLQPLAGILWSVYPAFIAGATWEACQQAGLRIRHLRHLNKSLFDPEAFWVLLLGGGLAMAGRKELYVVLPGLEMLSRLSFFAHGAIVLICAGAISSAFLVTRRHADNPDLVHFQAVLAAFIGIAAAATVIDAGWWTITIAAELGQIGCYVAWIAGLRRGRWA